jgi:hypothetical protein
MNVKWLKLVTSQAENAQFLSSVHAGGETGERGHEIE